eukprot:GILI01007635.1.p2 GENE.GILI01007635.1~~GILI01007635.1.p2  ORF type:complete len:145 (-),score=56.95 GILI01007635.1:55-489(-)
MVATKDSKAKVAARAQAQGNNLKAKKKIHTSVQFHRPHTLRLARKPKVLRKSHPNKAVLTEFTVIKHPLTTEAAMHEIENHNTLVFIVDMRSKKSQIKAAVKKMYQIKAAKVNTLVRPDGKKKAYVRLTADHDALDIANKIGVI